MYNVAAKIIKKCNGVEAVARYAGVSVTRVYRWTYPKERGGTNGLVPAGKQPLIISGALGDGIHLSPGDFFPETSTFQKPQLESEGEVQAHR